MSSSIVPSLLFSLWPCLVLAGSRVVSPMSPRENLLSSLLRDLRMKSPVFACKASLPSWSTLSKNLERPFRVLADPSLTPSQSLEHSNLIFCAEDFPPSDFARLLSTSRRNAVGWDWVALANASLSEELKQIPVAINQQAYVLNQKDLSLSESYTVNGHVVENIVANSNGEASMTWKTDVSFIRRRSNFKGIHLTAATESFQSYLVVPKCRNPKVKSCEDDWYPNHVGHLIRDVTDFPISGQFYEVLKELEVDLNFTTTLLQRKDGHFGAVINGTFVGMMADLARGQVDFVAYTITNNIVWERISRSICWIAGITSAVFVRKDGLEEWAWLSFLFPLTKQVWVCLLIITILALTASRIIILLQAGDIANFSNFNVSRINILKVLGQEFCLLFASFFGRSPSHVLTKSKSARAAAPLLVFFLSFSGAIVFMTFRSSLTSEMQTRRNNVPFADVEQLSRSNYALISDWKHLGSILSTYRTSKHGQWLWKMYQNQDNDETEFESTEEAMKVLMHKPKRAMLTNFKDMQRRLEYRCNLINAWRTVIPVQLSYAFRKDSPFVSFVEFRLQQMHESGQLKLSSTDFSENLDCPPNDDVSLGFLKLTSIFAMLCMGYFMALLALGVEGITGMRERPQTQRDGVALTQAKPLSPFDRKVELLVSRWSIRNREELLREMAALNSLSMQKTDFGYISAENGKI